MKAGDGTGNHVILYAVDDVVVLASGILGVELHSLLHLLQIDVLQSLNEQNSYRLEYSAYLDRSIGQLKEILFTIDLKHFQASGSVKSISPTKHLPHSQQPYQPSHITKMPTFLSFWRGVFPLDFVSGRSFSPSSLGLLYLCKAVLSWHTTSKK